jgi:N-acetyl-alpha-D-glucosaminyl L-malate synthase BshA
VTTLHGTDITLVGSHSDFYDLIRHAILASDAVTAVSKWLSEETATRFLLDEAPSVVPNFVDLKRFHPEGRAPHPGPEAEFTLVHASNLRPVKRIAHIIRVFQGVQSRIPARLVVQGDGPEKGMAQELVAQLGLNDRVHFDGISTDMTTVLRSAHMYLLLSDYESFGLSALEAMACGTPVAVSAAGGLLEVVEHNRTGLLCPAESTDFIARQIVDLLSDPDKWKAMGAAAAQAVRERFTVDAVMPRYEGLYKKVIEKEE